MISDYPSLELLSNISENLRRNVTSEVIQQLKISVRGHKWGEVNSSGVNGSTPSIELLTTTHAACSFTRIIVADCMWMAWEHENLCTSIVHFLEPEHGEMLAIAGFHTGRARVANFFRECERMGLVLTEEGIIEKSVEGDQREWREDRGMEDVIERKRWLTIGKFKMGKRPCSSELKYNKFSQNYDNTSDEM